MEDMLVAASIPTSGSQYNINPLECGTVIQCTTHRRFMVVCLLFGTPPEGPSIHHQLSKRAGQAFTSLVQRINGHVVQYCTQDVGV